MEDSSCQRGIEILVHVTKLKNWKKVSIIAGDENMRWN